MSEMETAGIEDLDFEICGGEWVEAFIASKQGKRWLRRSLKENMEEYGSDSEEEFFLELCDLYCDLPYGMDDAEKVERTRQRWLRDTAYRRYWELVAQQNELILEKCFSGVNFEALGVYELTAIAVALPLYKYGEMSPKEAGETAIELIKKYRHCFEPEFEVMDIRCWLRMWLEHGFSPEDAFEFWEQNYKYKVDEALEIIKKYKGLGYSIPEMIASHALARGFGGDIL